MRFTGSVKDGKVSFDSPEMWAANVKKLNGKRVEVSLEREGVGRSDPQNRRFWKVIVPVCREIINQERRKAGELTEWTKDETHVWLDKYILPDAEDEQPSSCEFKGKPRTCSMLKKAEFSRYMDIIEEVFKRRWGAVFPSEQDVMEAGL